MHHHDETLRLVAGRRKRRHEAVRGGLVVDVDATVRNAGLALDPIGFGGERPDVGAIDAVHDQVVEIMHQLEAPVDQGAAPAKGNDLLGGTLVDRTHEGDRPSPWIHSL